MNSKSFVVYLRCVNGDSLNNVFASPKNNLNDFLVGVVDISGELVTGWKEDPTETEVFFKDKPVKTLYLCSDIVSTSFVGSVHRKGISLPILRKIPINSSKNGDDVYDENVFHIPKVIYLNVTDNLVTSIRLYLTDDKGQHVALQSCDLNVTLLFLDSSYF